MTAAADRTSCPNCEMPAPARYCPSCGQRQSGRLTLRGLGEDFVARWLSAERGLWPSVRGLALRPGRVARAYLDGQRARYLSPIAYFVVGASAQVLALWLLRDAVASSVLDSLPDAYFDHLAARGVPAPRTTIGDRYLSAVQSAYSWLGLLTFVVPLALVQRLVLWRRANLAETFAVSLFAVGHVMLLTAALSQGLARVSIVAHGVTSYSLYAVYVVWTVAVCFGFGVRSLAAGVLGLAVGAASFLASLTLLMRYVLTKDL